MSHTPTNPLPTVKKCVLRGRERSAEASFMACLGSYTLAGIGLATVMFFAGLIAGRTVWYDHGVLAGKRSAMTAAREIVEDEMRSVCGYWFTDKDRTGNGSTRIIACREPSFISPAGE